MKKFNILLVFSLTVSMSFAQAINFDRMSSVRSSTNADFAIVQQEMQMERVLVNEHSVLAEEFEFASFLDLTSAAKAQRSNISPLSDLTTRYFNPSGTFFQGLTRDFRGWQILLMHAPAFTPIAHVPHASDTLATFAWTFNNGQNSPVDPNMVGADGTLNFESGITRAGSMNFHPRVTASVGSTTASFSLGGNVPAPTGLPVGNFILFSSGEKTTTNDASVFNGRSEFTSMTLVNQWLNRPTGGNMFIGFQGGEGFTPSHSNADGPVRGVMQIIPPMESPFFVESMSILAINLSNPLQPTVPDGGQMRLELFYLNEDDGLESIASSITRGFVYIPDDIAGAFVFEFYRQVGPLRVPAPFTIEPGREVVVRVTGFDDTWNFNIMMGTGGGLPAHSYTLHGENLRVHTFGYSNAPHIPQADMYIQFNGMFNVLMPLFIENEPVRFPVAGGLGVVSIGSEGQEFNDYLLVSALNLADQSIRNAMHIESPAWINGIAFEDDFFESQQFPNLIMAFFSAEPLPVGIPGRSGEIVLSLYGVSVTIPVVQGEGQTNIINPTVPNVNVFVANDAFELSYTSDFTTATIFNISGQAVRVIDLPTNGNVVIPTGDLARGTYIVRFAGQQVETVKVIK